MPPNVVRQGVTARNGPCPSRDDALLDLRLPRRLLLLFTRFAFQKQFEAVSEISAIRVLLCHLKWCLVVASLQARVRPPLQQGGTDLIVLLLGRKMKRAPPILFDRIHLRASPHQSPYTFQGARLRGEHEGGHADIRLLRRLALGLAFAIHLRFLRLHDQRSPCLGPCTLFQGRAHALQIPLPGILQQLVIQEHPIGHAVVATVGVRDDTPEAVLHGTTADADLFVGPAAAAGRGRRLIVIFAPFPAGSSSRSLGTSAITGLQRVHTLTHGGVACARAAATAAKCEPEVRMLEA
mmetsp:Transcript_23289/g.65836  ORF Transcript_23289/g.65836 Transcript_23289/m.65836 type:complete len:294 (+) Transcript_23289:148-1029(+)